jgi:hypothetical protein
MPGKCRCSLATKRRGNAIFLYISRGLDVPFCNVRVSYQYAPKKYLQHNMLNLKKRFPVEPSGWAIHNLKKVVKT